MFGQHIYIQGCFLHLIQLTYYKVQELGLQTQYREDQNLIKLCGSYFSIKCMERSSINFKL